MNKTTAIEQTIERPVLPLLFQSREYVVEMEGTTTACVWSSTSPVKEYTPDD